MSTRAATLGVAVSRSDRDIGAPDQHLWARLREADEQALTALFRRHSDAVYNFAFRRLSSWSAAEDAVQATFTSLWRRARSGRIDVLTLESARPLLLVMAGHECSNLLRSSRRHLALVDRITALDRGADEPDPAAAAASRLDDERAMARIREVLDEIPAAQREVVELVVWSECSMAEAARALGIPEGTVKSRLARARRALATRLDLGNPALEVSE
ncbi:sigma-70 family RNA polymerase sigma factor [Kribbella sp. NBC_01245]|uniref:RNA polymerase sigma factor n=1 Tax=Kribbella sp. NBC_01245 TaxID=2903578 RepID=UPI002E2B97DA|nr:sigma-70 family RNA polymerase sigma factor [Kribbella sp. NBC_01245]